VNRRRAGRAELLSGTGGMQTTHVSGDITSLQSQQKKHSGKIFSGGSSYSAPYDPINKIGLLPRNNTSVQEGSKTYVVSNGPPGGLLNGNRGGGTGGYRTLTVGAGIASYSAMRNNTSNNKPVEQLDPKEALEKKKRERESMKHLIENEGGKSVGAKYLHTNGKVPIKSLATLDNGEASSSGMDKEEEEDSASQSDMDDINENKAQRTRKRVFGIDSLRKIGYDPTFMPALTDAKQQKRKVRNPL